MHRYALTPDQRRRRWDLALHVARRDLERQEAMGRAFVHPERVIAANRRTFYARLVDDDDFYIKQRDLHYGEVDRPPKWPAVYAAEPLTLEQLAEQDAARARIAEQDAERERRRIVDGAADAIARYPWPRPPLRYLDHEPTPDVAAAITADLLAVASAAAAGRSPSRALREAWDRRCASAPAHPAHLERGSGREQGTPT